MTAATEGPPPDGNERKGARDFLEHMMLESELGSEIQYLDESTLADSACLKPSRWMSISTGLSEITSDEQSHIDRCPSCQKSRDAWSEASERRDSDSEIDRESALVSLPAAEDLATSSRVPSYAKLHISFAPIAAAALISATLTGLLVYWLIGIADSKENRKLVAENNQLRESVSRFDAMKSKMKVALNENIDELSLFIGMEPRFVAGDQSVETVKQTLINQGQKRSPVETEPDKRRLLLQKIKSLTQLSTFLESEEELSVAKSAETSNLIGISEALLIEAADAENAKKHFQNAAKSFRRAGESGLAIAWLNLYLLSVQSQEGTSDSRKELLTRYLESETDLSVRRFVRDALE